MTETSEKLQKYIDRLEIEADKMLKTFDVAEKIPEGQESIRPDVSLFNTTVHSLCFALAVQDQLSYEDCECDPDDKVDIKDIKM